ncbi:MAG: peptidoglycan DD-metalloendopeptidase family protein [Halioglobus sp.]|nr:peptidoglycan DD-metalloendopeptidase family protein [Halioglobus sp.]
MLHPVVRHGPAHTVLRLAASLLIWSIMTLPQAGLAQSDEEKTRQQLQVLEAEIQHITQELNEATNRQSVLQALLRDAEKELSDLQRQIKQQEDALVAGQQALDTLKEQYHALQGVRDRQQARIALELRTAWQLGRQGQIKVLLNQESPHTVARSLAYYRYFFTARNELLQQYRETLRELEQVQQQIAITLRELDTRKQALEQQRRSVIEARDTRQQVVQQLASSITSKHQQLEAKERDRAELEALLRAIQEAVVNLKIPKQYRAFKSARGDMPWPLSGKPSNQFNRPRNQGKMRWQGLTIPAPEGTLVTAIHHGHVVYADWLRGSGLLLIIDHGDGYMSLYAHNASLLREVGEWVAAGDPVSTVGNTGGANRHALYFEIRHDGKPVNPNNWCQG